MKRIVILLASLALVAGGLHILPASAQEAAPEIPAVVNIEDPAGDANYLNGQGFDESQGDNVTPRDLGSLSDILKVWFTSDADKVNAHIQTEALATGQNVAIFFRVQVDPVGGDANCLRFQGMTGGLNTPDAPFGSLRDLCGDADETITEGVEFKMEQGPDDSGIYTISVPRSAHPAFAEGTQLTAPTAHSRNYNGGGGVGVTAPQVDNTKPGLDFTVTSGSEGDPKSGKKTPAGKKKGCDKGKGKKRGCEGKGKKSPKPGKPSAACASFTPGEAGAEKPTVKVTDEATEDKPLEQTVTLDPSVADLDLVGLGAPPAAHDAFNIQVDSAAPDAGLYVLLEFPTRRDYDLNLLHPDGSYAARSRSFNPVLGTPGEMFSEPGHGGEGTDHSEKLLGIKTSDCGGWTLDVANYLGEGGEMTVKLWLGEAKIEPQPEGEETP